MPDDFEIEFRWKEEVIYWEGSRGVVFPSGWGVSPAVTITPDAATWDMRVPIWLRGRYAQVVARLHTCPDHVVREERDDSHEVKLLHEVTR